TVNGRRSPERDDRPLLLAEPGGCGCSAPQLLVSLGQGASVGVTAALLADVTQAVLGGRAAHFHALLQRLHLPSGRRPGLAGSPPLSAPLHPEPREFGIAERPLGGLTGVSLPNWALATEG